MTFAGAEADRRIANAVQVGVVTAVGPRHVRVRIGDLDTPELPVAQLRAGAVRWYWMPSVGEQVLVACPSGDVARGIVVASIPASNEPSADAGEPMIHLGGARMVIVGDLEVRGSVSVTEDVLAAGDMIVQGDVVASDISLVTHVHGGVTPGGGSTGAPE